LNLEFICGKLSFWVLKYIVWYFTFRFIFDAMHAVTGAYAKPIFVDKLGASLVFSG
jgi:phosphoglucomutase